MKYLDELKGRIYAAKAHMEKELQTRYPLDSQIFIKLNCRQILPSLARVIGHDGDGYVRVCLENTKENTRRRGRSIYYKNIM